MTHPATTPWQKVDSAPYAWPFDGEWSAGDTALLVIDVQHGLAQAVADDTLLDAMEAVIGAARRANLPVIFSLRATDAPATSQEPAAPDARIPLAGSLAAGLARPHWQLPGDAVVQRSAWSAFNGTDLQHRLEHGRVRNLVLVGLTTDGAVHASMRKANDAGFECLLIEDACASAMAAHHRTILNVTRFGNGLFGTTATAHRFIHALPEQ